METETIQVMGVTLRRPTQFQVSCASKSCTYLQNGFCVVCDCAACTGGFLIDEWKQRIRAGDAACGPRECACVQRARNRKHLRDSGLEKLVEKCTFDNFRTDTSWRKIVKDKALAYLKDCHSSSYYIGGQSGAGKTHICTAICGEIMRQGHKLRYFQWIKDGLRLKQIISEREVYEKELKTWAEVPLLYIDDLYKNEISDADIRLL